KDKGRIWRIVPEKHKTKAVRPNLGKATPKELAKLLEHEDAWWRVTAQRLLMERADPSAADMLQEIATKRPMPQARAHAGWLSERLKPGWINQGRELMEDWHPRVRQCGLEIRAAYPSYWTLADGPLVWGLANGE